MEAWNRGRREGEGGLIFGKGGEYYNIGKGIWDAPDMKPADTICIGGEIKTEQELTFPLKKSPHVSMTAK